MVRLYRKQIMVSLSKDLSWHIYVINTCVSSHPYIHYVVLWFGKNTLENFKEVLTDSILQANLAKG